jgi:hypothetical protein
MIKHVTSRTWAPEDLKTGRLVWSYHRRCEIAGEAPRTPFLMNGS